MLGRLLCAPIAGVAHDQLGSSALSGSVGQTHAVLAALVAGDHIEGAVFAPGPMTGIFCRDNVRIIQRTF